MRLSGQQQKKTLLTKRVGVGKGDGRGKSPKIKTEKERNALTLFNTGDDGGEVVIQQDHVSSLLAHITASNAHGHTCNNTLPLDHLL